MVSSTIKAVLISTGIAAVALFLKVSVPIAIDFSVSRFPILWSSFLSWLEPPYLFVVINVIIFTIVASSRFYLSLGDEDGGDDEILHGGDYKIQTEQIVEVKDVDLDANFGFVPTFTPPILVTEVERSEEEESVVVEEEIAGLINGGDKFVALKSKWDKVPSMMEESENLPPVEKPLVLARSGHRKPVKASPKGGNRRKALRVVKPKRHETSLENTWKMITEENKSTPLTSHYRRSDTFRVDAGEVRRPALRKSETFRDVTNYQRSPTPVKMKKEMSPSREELNRRVEAFIKKCKEERLESLRLDQAVA